MIKILIISLLTMGSAFAQSKGSTADAINAQMWASDGLELKSNFDPFMDLKLWDKDTEKNIITFKNTQDIKTEGGWVIRAKNYKVELNYENLNSKKKILNSMYTSRTSTDSNNKESSRSQSITELKDNKIQNVTGCDGGSDTKNKLSCSTTSRKLCDFIAKRSENFFRNKSDAKKCAEYIYTLTADLAKEQKAIVDEIEKIHQDNVNQLKAKGLETDEYDAEDYGLLGQLKKKPVDEDQVTIMSYISMYHGACSTFKMYEKESGRTRSLHRDESKSTKED